MKRVIFLVGLGVFCLAFVITLESFARDPNSGNRDCDHLVYDDNETVDEEPIHWCTIDFYEVTITDLKAIGTTVKLKTGFEADSASDETVHIKSAIHPAQKSIRGAHGSADDHPNCDGTRCHMDKVHAFLFGSDYCETTPDTDWVFPHCPSDWDRTQMHLNDTDTEDTETEPCDGTSWTNTNVYYYDVEYTTSGDDLDTEHGIDLAMVFFYAGHGEDATQDYRVKFDSLSGSAYSDEMLIGNGDYENDKGGMRYMLHHSCRMFAHGEKTAEYFLHHEDYYRPDLYDGGVGHENIYDKWSNALTDELRMACGYSTLSSSHPTILSEFWELYTEDTESVLDSWLEHNLVASMQRVPLCLARGEDNYNYTPFYRDSRFTHHANFGGDTVWMVYMIDGTMGTDSRRNKARIPAALPVLEASIDSVAQAYLDYDETVVEDYVNGMTGQVVDMYINPVSGAIVAKGEDIEVHAEDTILEYEQYVNAAEMFIEGMGWSEYEIEAPSVYKKLAQKATMNEGEVVDVENLQVGVTLKFRRMINIGETEISFLGAGGKMLVRMNNDGTVISATRMWRDVEPIGVIEIKSFEEAYEEALLKLGDIDAYELTDWVWGYKALGTSTDQEIMRIIYQFSFEPKEEELEYGYEPQEIEILGQEW